MVRADRRSGSRRPVHERDPEVRGLIDASECGLATVDGPRSYSADAIRDLNARVDGSLYVSGSAPWCGRCWPTASWTSSTCSCTGALGSGQRLFADGADVKFALGGSDTYENGVVHLDYRPPRSVRRFAGAGS